SVDPAHDPFWLATRVPQRSSTKSGAPTPQKRPKATQGTIDPVVPVCHAEINMTAESCAARRLPDDAPVYPGRRGARTQGRSRVARRTPRRQGAGRVCTQRALKCTELS